MVPPMSQPATHDPPEQKAGPLVVAVQLVPSATEALAGHVMLVPSHAAAVLHAVAVQAAPAGAGCCAGQVGVLPSHVDASAHPVAALQTWPLGSTTGVGQRVLVPVQRAASWQGPGVASQMKFSASYTSSGHTGLVPVQSSGLSQGPAGGRQTVVLVARVCPHVPDTHASVVQGLPSLQSPSAVHGPTPADGLLDPLQTNAVC
jgi:hypothetical protein